MDLYALREAVTNDRKEGLRPFCVVASAGTVNTGAVDPLHELADFCDEQGLWLHVDGAYGGFGILDPNVSHLYALTEDDIEAIIEEVCHVGARCLV
jgi:aromatic-L-amino-acid decarboxylase